MMEKWPRTVYLANIVNLAGCTAVSIGTRTALAKFIRWVPVNGFAYPRTWIDQFRRPLSTLGERVAMCSPVPVCVRFMTR